MHFSLFGCLQGMLVRVETLGGCWIATLGLQGSAGTSFSYTMERSVRPLMVCARDHVTCPIAKRISFCGITSLPAPTPTVPS